MTKPKKLNPKSRRKFVDNGDEFITIGDGSEPKITPEEKQDDAADKPVGYIRLFSQDK